MIDRNFYGGPLVVRCDGCAPAFVETGKKEFREAMAVAKRAGWQAVHCGPSHGWCHFCPDCVETKAWEDPANRLVAKGSARA